MLCIFVEVLNPLDGKFVRSLAAIADSDSYLLIYLAVDLSLLDLLPLEDNEGR